MKRAIAWIFAVIVATYAAAAASTTVGGLSYSITSVQRASSFGDETPAGEFIIVKLTVRNVGSKSATVSSSDFHLKRGETEYDSSSVSLGEGGFFLTQVNPGTAKSGLLVFDVPASTSPSKYRLIVYGNGTGDSKEMAL